jgi:hypothetical protein
MGSRILMVLEVLCVGEYGGAIKVCGKSGVEVVGAKE